MTASYIPLPPPAHPNTYETKILRMSKEDPYIFPTNTHPEAVMTRTRKAEREREREMDRVDAEMETHGGKRYIAPIPHHFSVIFSRIGASLGAAGALFAGVAGGEIYKQRTKTVTTGVSAARDVATFAAGFGAGALAQQAIGVIQSHSFFIHQHASLSKYFDYATIGLALSIAIIGGIYAVKQFNKVSNLANDQKLDDSLRAGDTGEAVSLAFVGAAFGLATSALFHYLSINDHLPTNPSEDGEHMIWFLQAKAAVFGIAAFSASIATFIVYDGSGQRNPELLLLNIFALILGIGAIVGALIPFVTTGVAVEPKYFPSK
jgi:hypothetical protein